MGILSRLKAALFQDPKPPSKTKTGQQATPAYLRKARGAKVPSSLQNTTNLDRGAFARNGLNINEVIKNLVRTSPELSQALHTKMCMAVTSSYTVFALDEIGQVDPAGTELIQAFTKRLDAKSYDYSRYTLPTDLRTTSSALLFDLLRYGDCGCEVILGPARIPTHLKPFSMEQISWEESKDAVYPLFKTKDGDVPLNYSTIFTSASTPELTSAYANSPIESAIQASLFDQEFVDTMRRACTKNLLQRLTVTINSEKWLQTVPVDVRYDSEKLAIQAAETTAQIEDQLNSLSASDALVLFDTLNVDTVADSNNSADRSIEVLRNMIDGNLSSGAKVLPSVLGRGSTSDAASTEAMLFVKSLAHLQNELSIMYSRMFTFVLALMGNTSTVVFKYEEPSLRPRIETASFRAVEASMVIEQLSLGFVSDIEASIALTGTVPPAGYVNKSGTMFKVGPIDTNDNPYSNTSATASSKSDSTQSTKNTKSDAPTGVKGKNP